MMFLRHPREMNFFYLTMILIQIIYSVQTESFSGDSDVDRLSAFFQTFSFQIANNTQDSVENLAFQLSPEDEIKLAGYPSETHLIKTEDGYILTIFRIPGSKGSTPVYLMHGFEESVMGWLISGKGNSLAYLLHDEGYDVWLGNARGNTYSKKHVNLTTDDPRFWDFSWTEIGIYDLPAVINYITNLSGKKLFYIGHSMGGTCVSVMGIERPDVAQKVKAVIGLAPGPYLNHVKSLPLAIFAPVWKEVYGLTKALNIYEFLPHGKVSDAFTNFICGSTHLRTICSLVTFIMAGYSPNHVDHSILQKFWSHFPAGTSVKLYVHGLQQLHSQTKFNRFDYGKETNLKIYNSTLPPAYDLSKMRIPTAVFWAENDILLVPQDIKDSYSQIPVKLGIYQVPDKTFNHLDFIMSKDAAHLVYSSVLKIMFDFDKQNN